MVPQQNRGVRSRGGNYNDSVIKSHSSSGEERYSYKSLG